MRPSRLRSSDIPQEESGKGRGLAEVRVSGYEGLISGLGGVLGRGNGVQAGRQ